MTPEELDTLEKQTLEILRELTYKSYGREAALTKIEAANLILAQVNEKRRPY